MSSQTGGKSSMNNSACKKYRQVATDLANTQSTNFFAASNNTTIDPAKLTSELRPKTAMLAPNNTFANSANRTGEYS